MTRALLAGLAVLLASSCAPPALEDLRPVSARLSNLNVWSVAAFGGVGAGGGSLTIDDLSGERFTVPVRLTTGTVGAMVELTTWGGAGFDLDLGFTEQGLTGDQIIGTYDGGYGNAATLIGVAGIGLENEHRVRFGGYALSGGFAMFAGHMWLDVAAAGEPVLTPVRDSVTDRPAP